MSRELAVDLEELERLYTAASGGTWNAFRSEVFPGDPETTDAIVCCEADCGLTRHCTAQFIAFTYRALPSLIAELRGLRAHKENELLVEEGREAMSEAAGHGVPRWKARITAIEAECAGLRAQRSEDTFAIAERNGRIAELDAELRQLRSDAETRAKFEAIAEKIKDICERQLAAANEATMRAIAERDALKAENERLSKSIRHRTDAVIARGIYAKAYRDGLGVAETEITEWLQSEGHHELAKRIVAQEHYVEGTDTQRIDRVAELEAENERLQREVEAWRKSHVPCAEHGDECPDAVACPWGEKQEQAAVVEWLEQQAATAMRSIAGESGDENHEDSAFVRFACDFAESIARGDHRAKGGG